MWRALVLAVIVTCVVLIGSAAYAEATDQPSKVVNAKSFYGCEMAPMGQPPPPPPKHWTVGDPIIGVIYGDTAVIPVTVHPEDDPADPYDGVSHTQVWVAPVDSDHWTCEGGPLPEGTDWDTVDHFSWAAVDGGSIETPADQYSAWWDAPDSGGFYQVKVQVDDHPKALTGNDTGTRNDDPVWVYADDLIMAVEATDMTVATQGQLETTETDFSAGNDVTTLLVTTPKINGQYYITAGNHGFFKRIEVRATITPELPQGREWGGGFSWKQQRRGHVWHWTTLADDADPWTDDNPDESFYDVNLDANHHIQMLDFPGVAVGEAGPPVPTVDTYEWLDLSDTGPYQFRNQVVFKEKRINKGFGDPEWYRDLYIWYDWEEEPSWGLWIADRNN